MASAAFISDIHANLEALTSVLADIEKHGYEEVFCLGTSSATAPTRWRARTWCVRSPGSPSSAITTRHS